MVRLRTVMKPQGPARAVVFYEVGMGDRGVTDVLAVLNWEYLRMEILSTELRRLGF